MALLINDSLCSIITGLQNYTLRNNFKISQDSKYFERDIENTLNELVNFSIASLTSSLISVKKDKIIPGNTCP